MITCRGIPRTDEEGASATLFILSLFAFLGIAMLAIDGGNLLASRQGQIADTDAAALAVAQSLIDDPCGNSAPAAMQARAEQYVQWNDPDEGTESSQVEVLPDFDPNIGGCPRSGRITVTTVRRPPLFFAPAFGFGDTPTGASSTVFYGQEVRPYGLVPIGICVEDGHYKNEWLPYYQSLYFGGVFAGWTPTKLITDGEYAISYPGVVAHPTVATGDGPWAGTTYPASSHVHRVTFANPSTGYDCGDAPGTFGWIDFDGDSTDVIEYSSDCPPGSYSPADELNCDLATGHNGPISLGPPSDCYPHPEDPSNNITRCQAQTGGVAAAKDALSDIAGDCSPTTPADDPSCRQLFIVVYAADVVDTSYRIQSIAGIVIRDYKATGAVADRYIDFEFVEIPAGFEIGQATSTSTAGFGTQQCGVDGFPNCGGG